MAVDERRGLAGEGDRSVLERLVPKMLEEAWTDMVKRYGFTPKTPVVIELYTEKDDYSIDESGYISRQQIESAVRF